MDPERSLRLWREAEDGWLSDVVDERCEGRGCPRQADNITYSTRGLNVKFYKRKQSFAEFLQVVHMKRSEGPIKLKLKQNNLNGSRADPEHLKEIDESGVVLNDVIGLPGYVEEARSSVSSSRAFLL
ncbi:hypothetical protein J6590_077978 [Homalodisca vitripennis]|nr:hypothetical protein J6590_077978 [Homalodisca vitripennis]